MIIILSKMKLKNTPFGGFKDGFIEKPEEDDLLPESESWEAWSSHVSTFLWLDLRQNIVFADEINSVVNKIQSLDVVIQIMWIISKLKVCLYCQSVWIVSFLLVYTRIASDSSRCCRLAGREHIVVAVVMLRSS